MKWTANKRKQLEQASSKNAIEVVTIDSQESAEPQEILMASSD